MRSVGVFSSPISRSNSHAFFEKLKEGRKWKASGWRNTGIDDMGTQGQLKRVEAQLRKDLEETTFSFQRLGEKYGVTKQAVYLFCHTKGVTRPTRPKRPETEHKEKICAVCRGLLEIAKKPHSDFISSHTIKKELGVGGRELSFHINILRKKGLVSQKFGRLRSRKAELAYQIYFMKRLPIRTIERHVGIEDFRSVAKIHKVLGWDVPAPLYDGSDQRGIQFRMNKLKAVERDVEMARRIVKGFNERDELTTFEASRILGISVPTIQRYCKKGILESRQHPITGRRFLKGASVEQLAKKHALL